MRITVVMLLLLSFAATAAPQAHRPRPQPTPPAPSQEQDREAIEDLHRREIAANMAMDVDKLAALWDEQIVAMPPNSPPLLGSAANRAYLAKKQAEMTNVDVLSYEEQWDEVRILGDYAYEYGNIKSRLRPADAKEETAISINIMRVLKREAGGDWKVYRTIWNDRKPPEPPTPPPKAE